ncbi:GT2 family glycosyltransferase [Nonlabens dokdonensis]|nr:GT2 family glycosyltransferase [Nonlabens dokdonensis]
MNRNDLSFLEEMFQKKVNQIKESVLIVNQSLENVLHSDYENIRVINSKEFGLSKSRNLAIKHSNKELCWILDDDCIVLPEAVDHVIDTHGKIPNAIITFQALVKETNELYYNYFESSQPHTKESIINVLSPEITFKRNKQIIDDLKFDERFGLGAQFEDSENFIFLNDAFFHDLMPHFHNISLVKHDQINSSQDFFNDRIIYARGALAAYLNHNITFRKWKYAFFLLKKGMILNPKESFKKVKLFKKGATDFKKSSEI